MKKIALLIIGIGLGVNTYAITAFNWYNSLVIVDASGTDVVETDTWLVRMYKSTDGFINFSAGNPTSDDVFTGIELNFNDNPQGVNGYFYSLMQPAPAGINPNDKVYSVIFNSSAYGSATSYAIIDDSLTTLAASFDPSADYDVGGTVASDWQAVPEPATFLLFGMGGFGAWLIRRKNRISK